jgi:hypothetical protein
VVIFRGVAAACEEEAQLIEQLQAEAEAATDR